MTSRGAAPADLDRRFRAFVVDRLLAWALIGAAAWALIRTAGPESRAGTALVCGAVALVVEVALAVPAGLHGTSPGRAVARIRLVDAGSGRPIGVARALGRQLVLELVTLPTCGLGSLALAWTVPSDPSGRRRGGHDRLLGSVVVEAGVALETPAADPPPRALVNLTALRLGHAPPAVPAPSGRPAPRPARPPVSEGGRWRVDIDTGESLVVEGPTLLGRDPEQRPDEPVARLVALSSTDQTLSKTHALLRLGNDGRLLLTDRSSTNGSTLERQGARRELTPERPVTLLDGDVVRLGDRRLMVRHETDDEPTTP